jgi:presenilin 1
MSPVSICMLLVVLIVYSLSSSNPFSAASAPPIRTAANLVYLESSSDSTSQKFEGALLNALVFVILIAVVTFFLVLLYYYNCTGFLKNYMRFSAFFVLGTFHTSTVRVYFFLRGCEVNYVTFFELSCVFIVLNFICVFLLIVDLSDVGLFWLFSWASGLKILSII